MALLLEGLTSCLFRKPAVELRPLIPKTLPAQRDLLPREPITVFLCLDPVAAETASSPDFVASVDANGSPGAACAHSTVASDSASTLVNPDSFPHTKILLSQVTRAILADPKQYVIWGFDSVLRMFCRDRFAHVDISPVQVTAAMKGIRALMTQYLHQPLLVCITSALEQPESGGVEWGLTNTKEDREDEYGFLIPALNWAHCSAFEATFSNPAMLARRSQLGSLLAITFMHELTNVFVRRGLQDMFRLFDREFVLSELHAGSVKTAPGWHFESLLFGGVVQVRWEAADVFQERRFELIEDVWLQTGCELVQFPPLRLIPTSNLAAFFSEIFYNTTLNKSTIFALWFAGWREHPYIPVAMVLQKDRILARGVYPRGQMSTRPPPTPGRAIIPTCLVGLERMAERYPDVYGKYWKYYE
ncbi:hypothetical protein C8R45DRAFT_984717 [Mycena sanguinolenta]|nr:hypothetical protein C8R45DRAFT_984717 [Mycena sanguinolenta]